MGEFPKAAWWLLPVPPKLPESCWRWKIIRSRFSRSNPFFGSAEARPLLEHGDENESVRSIRTRTKLSLPEDELIDSTNFAVSAF
jgi:hypothetical protein